MLGNRRVVVVMPAYNAATTLRRTVAEIDRSIIDEILVVDDASTDATIEEARRLGLPIELHDRNRGYGGCQKTCYTKALEHGADVIRDAAPRLPVFAPASTGDGSDDRLRGI